jgi:hypothetical protein
MDTNLVRLESGLERFRLWQLVFLIVERFLLLLDLALLKISLSARWVTEGCSLAKVSIDSVTVGWDTHYIGKPNKFISLFASFYLDLSIILI